MLRELATKWFRVFVATIVSLHPTAMLFAQCQGEPNVAAVRPGLGVVRPDGVRVIKIAFGFSAPPALESAMAKAIDQWNGKTGTTKISFSLVSSDPDVKINLDIQKSNCGDYRPTDGRPQFLDVSSYLVGALTPSPNPGGEPSAAQVEARIDKAAYPLAHELGHTMNLGESSDSSSIMSVPSYVQCNGAALDNFPARTVSEGDADRAVNCWKSVVRNDFAFDGDGSADHTETRYDCECSCWTQYQVIVGYQYADAPGGYVAVELQRWEIDSGCGEPPDM